MSPVAIGGFAALDVMLFAEFMVAVRDYSRHSRARDQRSDDA
jgi:hypothetical protein